MTLHCGSIWGRKTSSRWWYPSLTPVPVSPLSTYPASPPHGILEQLGQDVVQRHRDEGESGSHMSIDADAGGIAVLVLTQASVGRSKGSDLDQCISTGGISFFMPGPPPREIKTFLSSQLGSTIVIK